MSGEENRDAGRGPVLEERAPVSAWARRAIYGGGGPAGAVWCGVARPLARAWEVVAERRLDAPRDAARLPAPAIAIGNVTVGGGGKTSLVEWLLVEGLPAGTTPAVLTRGYGRERGGIWVLPPGPVDRELARAAGDEPALLARRGAWVAVGADRVRAAHALRAHVRPDLFLLDDALQHRAVARSLDLVSFTSDDLYAPAQCLPVGPLRQGAAWRPAFGAWVAAGLDPRAHTWPEGTIGSAFAAWWRDLPGTHARWEDDATVALAGWAEGGEEPFDPGDREVVALAGVAHPDSVRRSAKRAGIEVTALAAFPDHWAYSREDVAALLEGHANAAFVTTEKDAVKLEPEWFEDRRVGVLRRRLAPIDPTLLRSLVRDAIGAAPG